MSRTISLRDQGRIALSIDKLDLIWAEQSEYHQLRLYLDPELGHILTLNGEIQHVEKWAPLYHEPLVHLPVAFMVTLRSALLIGGGSLFALIEILKYPEIERILMLELDPEVVALAKRTYPLARKALEDPRLEISYGDAFWHLPRLTERFDLIVNDSIDLLEAFDYKIFHTIAGRLTDTGVAADLVYRHIWEVPKNRRTVTLIRKRFRSAFSLLCVPEYPGVLHLLALWGNSNSLGQDLQSTRNLTQQAWASNNSEKTSYFHPKNIAFYLYLPPYLKEVNEGPSQNTAL